MHDKTEIVAQEFGQGADFPVHTHFLQLGAPKVLERMFEHAGHFPGRRRNTCYGHDRMPIDFQDFVGSIVDHRAASRGTTIAGHEHAAAKFECHDSGRFGLRPMARTGGRLGDRRRSGEQTSPSQERGKILARAGNHLVKRHDEPLPSLARALAIAFGLIRIHFAHFLEQILRVGPGDIRRSRTAPVPLLWRPWNRIDRSFGALRHGEIYEKTAVKAS